MKKLYRSRGTVHPSPPLISDHLAFLPATILTLTAALTPEDREVLAYLLSCSSSGTFSTPHHRKTTTTHRSGSGGGDPLRHHQTAALFNCSCFGCYTSYWVKWDSSPNRQLIHEIIDSFEDWLLLRTRTTTTSSKNHPNKTRNKKERRKRGGFLLTHSESDALSPRSDLIRTGRGGGDPESAQESTTAIADDGGEGCCCGGGGDDDGDEVGGMDNGSVRKFVTLIGERIWNVWGQ